MTAKEQCKIPPILRMLDSAQSQGYQTAKLYDLILAACTGPFDAEEVLQEGLTLTCAMKGQRILAGEDLTQAIESVFPDARGEPV